MSEEGYEPVGNVDYDPGECGSMLFGRYDPQSFTQSVKKVKEKS